MGCSSNPDVNIIVILKIQMQKNFLFRTFFQQEQERQLISHAGIQAQKLQKFSTTEKDNTGPIVNPTYFMREGSQANSVTIQAYKNTVLKKNLPLSSIPPNQSSRKQIQTKMYKETKKSAEQQDMPSYQNFDSVQNIRPNKGGRPKSAGPTKIMQQNYSSSDDLPDCTFKALLSHIIEQNVQRCGYESTYFCLCHKYGDEREDQVWQPIMDQLER